MKTEYVVGFLVDPVSKTALLLKKEVPWLYGWNGVGGHIEAGETPLAAMVREFEEEVKPKRGVWTDFPAIAWEKTIHYELEKCVIHVFRALTTYDFIYNCTARGSEFVLPHRLARLHLLAHPADMEWILPIQFSTRITFPLQVIDPNV